MKRPTRSAPSPFPIVDPAEDVVAVVEAFSPIGPPEALAGRPHLVRFEDEFGNWVARRLPTRQSASELKSRHAWLTTMAGSSAGLAPAPHPKQSFFVGDLASVEIVRFIPGTSWASNGRLIWAGHGLMRPLPPPHGGMASLAALVAGMHSLDAPKKSIPVLSLKDYLNAQRVEWKSISEYIARSGVRQVHVQRWQSASQRVIFAAWDVLEDAGILTDQIGVPSHNNLWSAHVISNSGRLTLVDWSRSCIASPLIDVAQLIARFSGWSAASLEEVVESYMAVRTLTADERRLLPVFGALDMAVETGKLLAEAYVADLDQTSQYAEMARSGAGAMLGSLESIGWSIRKTNIDSKELRRDAKEHARAVREPGRKPRPKQQSSKRPKQ